MPAMTQRERILAVFRGETPDVVPYMLDLSHWFYHSRRLPWDLSQSYVEPERPLIDYHRGAGVGFYMPNLAAFVSTVYPPDVKVGTERRTQRGVTEIAWRLETPLGVIQRARVWEEQTYAWGISQWGIRNEADLQVFRYAMSGRRFVPHWDRHLRWDQYVGHDGVVYLPLGYSAMGHLLHYWMGIEAVVYATVDYPDLMYETVASVNQNTLELVDLICRSPAQIVIVGDNFSSDVQPPAFFARWSRSFYQEAIARLHDTGKFVAVHVDGKLKGSLQMIREVGADCADAVTPKPTGDLTPEACRAEAGPDLILSGGVAPNLWLPSVSLEDFQEGVVQWLRLSAQSPRLIAGAGDQVPPGAAEGRIEIMRDLVEKYGRYRH